MTDKRRAIRVRRIVSLAVLTLLFAYLLFGGAVGNNIKGRLIEAKLKKYKMPENTSIVDTISLTMNTSGTGNHCEIVYALVLRSELPPEIIKEEFQQKGLPEFCYYAFPYPYDNENEMQPSQVIDAVDEAFYGDTDRHGGDFIFLIGVDEAFSQMDIRGH
ncbi:MAG: hypothetical protein IKI49_01220 [Oscillospiraceae bacterium]|nr:hypothetical protein [Oscillospiraceae bacterium]